MPFLRDDPSPFNVDVPTTNLLMRNPFLIFRLVFLALLSNIGLLSLIFASWNISATLSVGYSVPTTSIFIVFESCLLFLCVALALIDFFRLRRNISRAMLECVWVGILSLFQIGAAISSTVNGPAIACYATADWNICASSSLLVPTTWLSSLLSLAYFLTLFITTMAHKRVYPDIWKRTVYGVEWFGGHEELPSKEKSITDFCRKIPRVDDDPYFDHYEDIESTSARKRHYPLRDSIGASAPWASAPVRRGVDPPFATRPTTRSDRSSPTTLNVPLPSFPDKSAGSSHTSTRFIEKFRESSVLARSETSGQFTTHHHARQDSFPPSVADIDSPIPLPRLSEWVRADALKGIDVHSNPHTLDSP
ncbi:hypothetical protein B0H34DRAFT_794941 [Crassisporium funariophilum]|nr:hypothetical protein B0H34DRAFT_794941 [Crassisporium funariophilum]